MKSVLLKILLILSFLPFSQVWGADFIPAITNYTVKDYEGGHQNWACAQGDDGVMYFGNNNGLLVYDGFSWELHRVPGGYIVRSVFVDGDRVYIGSFEEFGYFIRKTDGQMQYYSLSAGVKDKISSNDEIWHIVRLGEKIYFQSFTGWYSYDGKAVSYMDRKSGFRPLYFYTCHDKVYAQMINGGFYEFDGQRFHLLLERTAVGNDNVVAILPYGNSGMVLLTVDSGLFVYEHGTVSALRTDIDAQLRWAKGNRAVMVGDSILAIGTILDGIYGVDKDGNSNLSIGLAIAKKERIKKKNDSKTYAEYINYLGQYANYPAESFSSAAENIFTSEELTAWEERLRIDKDFDFYVDGILELDDTGRIQFKSNERLSKEGKKVYDYIIGVPRRANEDPHGCIRRWFPPEYDENYTEYGLRKEIPAGRYSISYDPVGIDKDKKEITNKHSHNSIKVWMNPCIKNGFKQKLVASYYGRPDSLEEADRICYYLAVYYNCIGTTCVEVNRGETVKNFRDWRATKYLAKEPLFVWDNTIKGKISTTYGYNIGGGNQRKLDALRLLKEFLYDEIGKDENGNPIRNFHRIYDYQTILELKKWSALGNFDRVSEMIIRGIEYKAMDIAAKDEMAHRKKITTETDDDNKSFFHREWY